MEPSLTIGFDPHVPLSLERPDSARCLLSVAHTHLCPAQHYIKQNKMKKIKKKKTQQHWDDSYQCRKEALITYKLYRAVNIFTK